jgi:hypothetical protein
VVPFVEAAGCIQGSEAVQGISSFLVAAGVD